MRISLPAHRHGLHRGQALLRRAPHRRAHGVSWAYRPSRATLPICAATRDGEIEQFINAFTVNETYFYREDHQLRCLSADLLAERVRAKPPGEALRIWSVPCSTGEEPYSIAIWLLENWPVVDVHDIEIVGSDIDTECSTAARAGRVRQRALMRLSPELVEKYFVAGGNGPLAHPRRPARVRAVHHGEHRGAGGNPAAWRIRRHLLPQRADLFRRCLPAHRGGESLRELSRRAASSAWATPNR